MHFEDIDKKMERWHNRLFPIFTLVMIVSSGFLTVAVSILLVIHFNDLAEQFNSEDKLLEFIPLHYAILFFIYLSVPLPLYLIYVIHFTKFNFTSRESGGGQRNKKKLFPRT